MAKKVIKIKRVDGISQGYHVGSDVPIPTSSPIENIPTLETPEKDSPAYQMFQKHKYAKYNEEQKIIDRLNINEPPITEGPFQYFVEFEPDSHETSGWNRKHTEEDIPKGWRVVMGERGRSSTKLNAGWFETREDAIASIDTVLKERRLAQALNKTQLPLYNPEAEQAEAQPLLDAPEGPWKAKLVYDELSPVDVNKTTPGWHEGWNIVAYSPNWEGRETKDTRKNSSHKGAVYITKHKGYATREEAAAERNRILENMKTFEGQPRPKMESQSYMFEPQPWLGQDKWNDPTLYGTE